MLRQELSAKDRLYGQVGAFFDEQAPKIICGITERMSSGEIPLYFCQPIDPDKIYSIAYESESLSGLPDGTFFGEQNMSLHIEAVTMEEKRPRDRKVSKARTIHMFLRQAGERYIRPYDAEHPLTSWAVSHDASRGFRAMYTLLLSPEAPPTVISNDHEILPTDIDKPPAITDDPWETVALLQDEGYEPYRLNDYEATLVLNSLAHIAAMQSTAHLFSESIAQYYCEQTIYPRVPTVGMYMKTTE